MTLIAATTLAATAITASPAAASTTASCPTGLIITIDFNLLPSPATIHFTSGCPGFVDNGAPYVFDIAQLTVFPIVVDPLGDGRPRTIDNIVETCSSITTGSNGLVGMNCKPTT